MWLSRVREARPIYKHSWLVMAGGAGAAGHRPDRLRADALAEPATMRRRHSLGGARRSGLIALALLFWQTRAGPAAQLLSVPGATALAWWLIGKAQREPQMLVRVLGTVLASSCLGLAVQNAVSSSREAEEEQQGRQQRQRQVPDALAALRPIARQPKGYVFTHVDLGPRLITVTHHDASRPLSPQPAGHSRRHAELPRHARECRA
jgi:hypothetical protein